MTDFKSILVDWDKIVSIEGNSWCHQPLKSRISLLLNLNQYIWDSEQTNKYSLTLRQQEEGDTIVSNQTDKILKNWVPRIIYFLQLGLAQLYRRPNLPGRLVKGILRAQGKKFSTPDILIVYIIQFIFVQSYSTGPE